ncbi:MAG: coenzyme F420 hydrogenase/dehydrogenase beta subunit N-terminal domain-containing protein [Bacteroidales bacterium]
MSVRNNKQALEELMRSELCNRCGTCVGLSGGAIRFSDREGRYLPEIVGELEGAAYERILNACSGKHFDFPQQRSIIYPDTPHFHIFTGPYHSISIGYASDPELRSKGASGGIISTLLIYLLEKKRIDGAVVTRMSREKPWLTEPVIATTREEILEASQSKYILTSVNEILDQMASFKGTLAYVGLPGQVHSIRMLQKAGDPAVAAIKYIFGPFYGNTLYFSSVRSFLKSHGERDFTRIKELHFRHGEWPGNMRVEMQSGRVIELKKFHANYLIPFHIVKNSLFCTDFSNEFTDISSGDAWAPVYEERGKGFSMVMGRSQPGQSLLAEMEQAGWLHLTPLSETQSIEMHSHGYDFKKRGAFIRLRFRKLAGKDVPDWGYQIRGFSTKRIFMEVIISTLFILLGTRLARWTVEQFSPTFIGKIFERTRTTWKKSTHHIKRESLNP